MNDRMPGPRAALGVFFLAMFCYLVMSVVFLVSRDLALLLVEPMAFILPVVLVARRGRLDIRKTLRLYRPSPTDLLVAIPLAFSLIVVNDQLLNLTSQVFPFPEDFQRGMVELLRAENLLDWVIRILGIGVGAAVSEEILFRGFIQKGFENGLRHSHAIVITAVLFAVMHMIWQGIPSYAVAGIVLGTAALATGSIFIPIAIHFIYNMSTVALLSLADIETLGEPVWLPASILVPALLIFGMTFGYFVKKAAAVPASHRALPTKAPADLRPPTGLSDRELASISPQRRRLGWLALGCAVAWGTLVISGLFAYSLYNAHSGEILASAVEQLKREVLQTLPPSASSSPGDADEITREFDVLAGVAKSGKIGIVDIGRLYKLFVDAQADGFLSEVELDEILEEVRSLARSGSGVKRL